MVSLLRSLKTKANTAFLRITLTRITALFFLFSFVHCFAQGILQASIFRDDDEFGTMVSKILAASDIPKNNISYLTGPGNGDYTLQICNNTPIGLPNPSSFCTTVFPLPSSSLLTTNVGTSPVVRRDDDLELFIQPTQGGVLLSNGVSNYTVTPQCASVLIFFDGVLKDSKRETVTLIFLQFWFFIISFIALMYDSIPHTMAMLAARLLILTWSCFSFRRNWFHQDEYNTMVKGPVSACQYDFYPGYFQRRFALELPDMILNGTAFLISAYLSLRLLKTYREQQFTSMGAPPAITKIYKYFMGTMASLQLSVFFLLTAQILWANELLSTNIFNISEHTTLDLVVICVTAALVVPLLSLGWYAITREHKVYMGMYLALGLIFLGGWAGMLYSRVYRFSLANWAFLATGTAVSFVLLISSLVCGTICFLNFGQGFSNYLHAVDALDKSDFLAETFPTDIEKVNREFKGDSAYGNDDTRFYAPSLHYLHSGATATIPITPPPQSYNPDHQF